MELDSISFDQFIRKANPFKDCNPEFDLNGYTLLTPTSIVSLSALVRFFAQGNIRPLITVFDQQVRGYLIRSRFIEAVSQYCEFNPPISTSEIIQNEIPRGNNNELFEVSLIDNSYTLRSNLKNIVDMLENKFHYTPHEAYDITTIISESSQNIYDHNPGTCGFIAFQTYRATNGSKFLEVGLSDFGAGIQTTLKRNPNFAFIKNDIEAIEKAVELGTSQYIDPTRGNGLYHLMQTIKKYNGTVQIRSGQATIRCRFDTNQPPKKFLVPFLPGVHITIKLDAK